MRSNKGITMLALVITVIILIILTSITVSLIIGQDGLIDKSKDATNEVGIMQIDEEINAMWAKLAIGRSFSSLSLDERAEAFENELKKYDSDATVVITNYSKKEFTINYKGLEKIFIAQRNAIASTVAEEPEEGGNTNPNTDPTQHPDTVTITFVSNGGTEIASQTIPYGTTAEKPAKPKKAEYDFIKWYSEETLETAFDFTKPVNKDTTLYARWYAIVDYYTYTVSNNVATITGFSPVGLERYNIGEYTDLEFPTSYNGNTVTTIGSRAFKDKNKITSISLHNMMKKVGESAFGGCTSLQILDIPNSITLLEVSAFSGCTGLTRVEIPCNTQYYYWVFSGCSNIEYVKVKVGNTTDMSDVSGSDSGSVYRFHYNGAPWFEAKDDVIVEIENGVTRIGDYRFYKAAKVGKIIIPSSVTTIGDYAFSTMAKMTAQTRSNTGMHILTIPDTVTTIEKYVFRDCSNLESYEVPKAMIDAKKIYEGTYYGTKVSTLEYIPTEIETIGSHAFRACNSLPTNLVIPNNIKKIDNYAFYGLTQVINLNLSNTKTIGDYAFKGLTSMTSLDLSQTQTVGESAFSGCTSLPILDIPNSTTLLEVSAFSGCTGLTRVEIPCDTQYYYWVFNGCSNIEYVKVKVGNTTDMLDVSGSDSGSIYRFHYNGAPWFEAKDDVIVEIENGVTRIGSYRFYKAAKVGKVIIPSSVTTIGNYTFSTMTKMTAQTRSDTGMHILTIPDTVTTIGNSVFRDSSNLEDYEVPKAMIDAKKINEGTYCGTKVSTLECIPNEIVTIGNSAFMKCLNLPTNLVIPNSIKTIERESFRECTNITSLDLSQTQTIGKNAFRECTNMTSLDLSQTQTVGESAFSGCTSLPILDIPNSTTLLDVSAFSGCTGLTRVEIPCNTQYYYWVFNGCSNIEYVKVKVGNTTDMLDVSGSDSGSIYRFHYNGAPWFEAKDDVIVEIENGITRIGDFRFYKAVKVGKIIIPSSVTTIGDYAFSEMTQMTTQTRTDTGIHILTIPDTVTTIEKYVFRDCSNLESYEVPKAMIDAKKINEGTYYGTKVSTLEYIPTEIETIGSYAFRACNSLPTNLVIPNNIKKIDNYAFYGLTQVINLNLSNTKTIGDYAFKGLTSMTSLDLSQTQTVGESAFGGCTSLPTLDIPNSTTLLEVSAFSGCTGLTRVEIPCDTKYYYWVFSGCSNISNVKIKLGNTNVMSDVSVSDSGGIYRAHYNGAPWFEATGDVIVEIEDGVTTIGSGKFYKATKIKEVIIPTSVTEIGNYVFKNCSDSLKINYKGTAEQWTAITKGTNNDKLSTISINYNYSGI